MELFLVEGDESSYLHNRVKQISGISVILQFKMLDPEFHGLRQIATTLREFH